MTVSVFILVFVLAMGFFAWLRRRDARFLKKRTREVMNPDLLAALEKEKEEVIRKKEKFAAALGKASERYRKKT